MKCVIYSRVSTEEQSTANQVNVLNDWANTRGFIIGEVYQEQESAWRDGHQRELAQLLRDAHRGRFSTVLVWSLDRLSREGSLAILQLVNKLSRLGVKVLSYQEPWTEAPGEIGELLYALTGWVARMESQRRSERTKAGLARVKANGRKLGRPLGSRDKKKRRRRVIL
ncbi:recombinase family protein [Chloroflexota bacterium]